MLLLAHQLTVKSALYFICLLLPIWVCIRPIEAQGNSELGDTVVAGLSWSSDGSRIAIGYGPGRCSDILNDPSFAVDIVDITTGQIVNTFASFHCQPKAVAWNPNSNILAIGSDDRGLWLWNPDTAEVIGTFDSNALQGPRFLRWSPDGQKIAQLVGYHLEIFDLATSTVIALEDVRDDQRVAAVSWSEDGSQLATIDDVGNVYILDPSMQEIMNSFSVPVTSGIVLSMDWGSSEGLLAVGDSEGRIYILNSTSGVLVHTFEEHMNSVLSLAFDASENLLASGSRDGTVRIWNISDLRSVNVINHDGDIFAVAWSPDGRQLAFGGLGDFTGDIINQIVIIPTPTPTLAPTDTATDTPTPTFTPTPPPTGGPNQILFASSVTGLIDLDIYRINPDGTGLIRLTNVPGNDAFPAWSPDGSTIVFASTRDGDYEIFTMNPDGSNPMQLTSNTAADEFPVFSPDGSRIAFSSNRDGNWELYVMNADGSNPIRLTNHSADDLYASWSPDGTKIAFSSLRDGNYEIYDINPDGTNLTRLTNHPARDEVPNWSPDGSQIAFTSNRDGNLEIYAMNADGTNVRRLTSHAAVDEFPNWSADGSEIVFSSSRSSFFNLFLDIHVMNADGTNVRRLTSAFSFDRFPAWGYP